MSLIKRISAFVLTAALLVVLFACYGRMVAYRDSFDRREALIGGSIPAVVYLPKAEKPPIVIVAHGFTADKEMMQSLAYSLVRDGFAVVTFDFRGHGQNDTGFDHNRLQEDMEQVVTFCRNLNKNMPYGKEFTEVDTERIAIIGHSMGGGAVVNYGFNDSDIDATVPVSGVAAAVSERRPKNLFIIYAQNDPDDLRQAAREMLGEATGEEQPAADTTYGSFENGSARRLSMVKGTDHLTILISSDAQRQILNWLHEVWEIPTTNVEVSDPRLAWMGVTYILSFFLFFCCCYALSWYLPPIPRRTGLAVVLNLVALAVVCFLTLFVIMPEPPLSFIPMPVGDYLISYFFIVGIIYFLVASWRGNVNFADFTAHPARTTFAAFVLFLLVYLTFGMITTQTWFRQLFTGQRLLWALVMLPLLLPFFIGFEASVKRGNTLVALIASLLGVFIFLGAIVLGVMLGLTDDFVMLIIIPMVLFNIVFQLFSVYVYHLSRNYFVTALLNAMIMAWQYAILFPIR